MTQENKTKPKAVYNPGELDKTRKNIGDIEIEEAKRMAKILGGKVGVEKAPMYENPQIHHRTYSHRQTVIQGTKPQTGSQAADNTATAGQAGKSPANGTQPGYAGSRTRTAQPGSTAAASGAHKTAGNPSNLQMPAQKERALMDKLMSSPEYRIKPNRTLFGYIISLVTGSNERVTGEFITGTLGTCISRIQSFSTAVRQIISAADNNYKTHVSQDKQFDFRLLKFIYDIDMRPILSLYRQLEEDPDTVDISRLIPLIKLLYRILLPLYYTGEKYIPALLKAMYAATQQNSILDPEILLKHTRDAAAAWIFIYRQAVNALYPLLMRMCSPDFQPYPDFFKVRAAQILTFLDLTKFDLFIPSRKQAQNTPENTGTSGETADPQNAETAPDGEPAADTGATAAENGKQAAPQAKPGIVEAGLDFLDRMFPDAGWKNLPAQPDMYPYYQPMYNFSDGFNLLPPDNPLQVTVVLLRILEDFFQGCRHIKFSIDKEPAFSAEKDDVTSIFADWSLYRETVFDKTYASELKDYVNHVYMQSDFPASTYAKKVLTNLMWQAKYAFLPHLSFPLFFMEKPIRDTTYKPLPRRINYLKRLFSELISRIESFVKDPENAGKEIPDFGALNIMQTYHFDVPNSVSKRIDILLGKKPKNTTNFNLLKYCMCVISVLDWWINDPNSPAYENNGKVPYRVASDGSPVFSVSTIDNPDKLFITRIKQHIQNVQQHKKTDA